MSILPPARQHQALWSSVLIAVAYVLVNFVLTKNVLVPVHQDDYLALGFNFADMRWHVNRPVSMNFIYFLGGMGPSFAFTALSVMTVGLAVLVMRFQVRVFNREFAWPSAVLFAAIAFSHMASYEHGKLLGLATTLTSNVTGLVAMCLLWDAWTRRSPGRAMAAVLAYALSVFAKEDYVLPPLVLLAWFWISRLRAATSWRAAFRRFEIVLTVGFGLVVVSGIAYNFLLTNPFVSGLVSNAQTDPYAVDLAPGAIASAFWKLSFGYAPCESMIAVAAFIAGVVLLPRMRWALALMAALVLVLMLPYALIPNNMPEFRVYGWLPWFGGVVAAVIAAVVTDRLAKPLPRTAAIGGILFALALALVTFLQAYPHRKSVAIWYAMQGGVNTRMLAALDANRASIQRESVVGILGVDTLSPWSHTDAEYLRKLGFANKWVVFVPADSMFFKRDPLADGVSQARQVMVEDVARVCMPGRDLLLLAFDASGEAKAVRSHQWCASH